MRFPPIFALVLCCADACSVSAQLTAASPGVAAAVQVERVPNQGIQPQVQVERDGTVHLLYYSGDELAGDINYAVRTADASDFSVAMRVNSQTGSAISTGSIRGAQLALDGGRVIHVVWNGSQPAEPKGAVGELPLLYSRRLPGGAGFEHQRNLITAAYGLDGGACVAAGPAGDVYVAWHAGPDQEDSRRIWLVHSSDRGQSFSEERAIDDDRLGACGCCGMTGTLAPGGQVMFLYRSAFEQTHRDMYLLRSEGAGKPFVSQKLQEWSVDRCPMSSAAFAHHGEQSWAAWESADQVYLSKVRSGQSSSRVTAAPGIADHRKHPRLAVNQRGELLLAWTEGTGWKRGGRLAWQLYDVQGQPSGEIGSMPGVPVWSFPAVYARHDGVFVILY